jgi:hypothetical protein
MNTTVTRERVWAAFSRTHDVRLRERYHAILLLMDSMSCSAMAQWLYRDEEMIPTSVHALTVIVQGVVRSGDPGRLAICLFLKRSSGFPIPPHARGPAERCNFSYHPSRSLVYSQCSPHLHSPLTNVALPWHTRQRSGGAATTFEEILDAVMAMLQRRGRVTYRTLKRQFQLDDDAFEDLKDELLYAHPHVVEDDGRGLVWTGEARPTPMPGAPPAVDQVRAPLSYNPALSRPRRS